MGRYVYENVYIQRVVDGDTVILEIDYGMDLWHRELRVRLAHINAPELATEAGQAAKAYLAALVPVAAPQVILETLKDRTDNYGRYLGVLTTLQGLNVNQAMLDAGHAVPSEGRKI